MGPVILRGPADADHYRRQVGRFGERHYVDPLDADDVWPTTDEAWPAVSTVKKATGEDWSHVALRRVSTELIHNPKRLDGLDREEHYATLRLIDEGGLRRAGERGTSVHRYAELRLRGEYASMLPGDPAWDYRRALDAFFDEYEPSLYAAEVVAIHRALNGWGFGGTLDAVVVLRGKLYLVDWKSRSASAAHRCTADEAAQVSGYGRGQYWIVDDHGPRRIEPPRLDGGLIVSIRPDGCRVYPIDLDVGFEHFTSLHAWWVARRSETKAIGKAWAPISVDRDVVDVPAPVLSLVPAPDGLGELKARVRERVAALLEGGLWVELDLHMQSRGLPELSTPYSAEQLAALVDCCRAVEDSHSLPFHPDDAPKLDSVTRHPSNQPRETPPAPPEGEQLDQGDIDALANHVAALSDTQQAWVTLVAKQAGAAHRSISIRALPSVRRFEIVRALLIAIDNLWDATADAIDDELLRAIASAVLLDLAVEDTALPLGEIFGSLTIDTARRLARALEAIGTDSLRVVAEGDALHISGSALAAD